MSFRTKINGDKWTIEVVSAREMKKHRDDGTFAGLCVPEDKTIYIDEDCITYQTICHELFHSYFNYLYLDDTSNLHIADFEEIMATMMSEKGDEIVSKAKRIYKKLKKEHE